MRISGTSWREDREMRQIVSEVYMFPENLRAKEATLDKQLRKVMEEAGEAWFAHDKGEGDDRIIEELWDVVQAAEGALRKFPKMGVLKGFAVVRLKGHRRGDYRGVRE